MIIRCSHGDTCFLNALSPRNQISAILMYAIIFDMCPFKSACGQRVVQSNREEKYFPVSAYNLRFDDVCSFSIFKKWDKITIAAWHLFDINDTPPPTFRSRSRLFWNGQSKLCTHYVGGLWSRFGVWLQCSDLQCKIFVAPASKNILTITGYQCLPRLISEADSQQNHSCFGFEKICLPTHGWNSRWSNV